MPCPVSEEEKSYYANMPAKQYLGVMNVPVRDGDYANRVLCALCSKMSLQELKDNKLENWYLDHLFIDGRCEPQRVLAEILRIYRDEKS